MIYICDHILFTRLPSSFPRHNDNNSWLFWTPSFPLPSSHQDKTMHHHSPLLPSPKNKQTNPVHPQTTTLSHRTQNSSRKNLCTTALLKRTQTTTSSKTTTFTMQINWNFIRFGFTMVTLISRSNFRIFESRLGVAQSIFLFSAAAPRRNIVAHRCRS